MGLIIGLYMSFDFDSITNQFIKIIPEKHQGETVDLIDNIGRELAEKRKAPSTGRIAPILEKMVVFANRFQRHSL